MPSDVRTGSRARADATLAAALRHRIPHLLGQASSAGDRVPPSAVLIVRRLHDPWPRGISPSASRLAGEWDAALRDAIGDRYRRAARPAREPVDPGADAVAFEDMGELLAAVARDLVGGTATSRWWWRSYLRARASHSSDLLAVLWESHVLDLPRAIALLVARGDVVGVLTHLEPSRSLSLARALVEAYALPELRALVEMSTGSSPLDHDVATIARSAGRTTPLTEAEPVRRQEDRSAAAFRNLVEPVVTSSEATAMAIEHRILLLVATSIAHAPSASRRAGFAAAAVSFVARAKARVTAPPPVSGGVGGDEQRSAHSHRGEPTAAPPS